MRYRATVRTRLVDRDPGARGAEGDGLLFLFGFRHRQGPLPALTGLGGEVVERIPAGCLGILMQGLTRLISFQKGIYGWERRVRLIAAVLGLIVLGSRFAVAAEPPPLNLVFKANSKHAYQLADLLVATATETKAVYEDDGRTQFLILDEVALAKRAVAAAKAPAKYPDLLRETRWSRACGIRGPEYVLATLDDRSGTPTDWTRISMVARGKQAGLVVYGRHDAYEALLLNVLAHRYQIKIARRNAYLDSYAVSQLVRRGNGLALIGKGYLADANVKRRGVVPALFLSKARTSNVPSVTDLGVHLGFEAPFPGRYAVLFVRGYRNDDMTKWAKTICGRVSDKALDVATLRQREERFIAWAKAVYSSR